MLLIISCFLTNQRLRPNRYDRIDIFKYTLSTYKNLNFSEVFLYIKLDSEYENRKSELEACARGAFPNCPVNMEFWRQEWQHEWTPLISNLYEKYGKDELVWFLQNDDHPFIDIDTGVVEEGIEIMKNDTESRFKTLYFSHWPEIVLQSGKLGNQERVGKSYIKCKGTLVDSIQIFNMEYLKHLFIDLSWNGNHHKKIDGLVISPTFLSREWTHGEYRPEECWQTIYVPMRELCRKFDGYAKENVPHEVYPPLQLPPAEIDYSREALMRRMCVRPFTPWTVENKFRVPMEWVNTMLELYGHKVL
jgi:hypothetical protein